MFLKISSLFLLWNWRKILFLWTNPSNEVFYKFCVKEIFKYPSARWWMKIKKGQKLKLGEAPHGPSSKIFKKTQAAKLGDTQGIPFFINNHRFYSWYYIFIPLYIMCCSWSVGLFFYFQIVCVSFLVLAIIRILACLFGRETRSAFSLYTPVLHLYVLSV